MGRDLVTTAGAWIERHSYLLLCCALLPMVVWRAVTGTWLADFWEHAAVVGELAANPFDPNHPMLAIDAPHALNSPYHLVLGLVAAALDASSVAVLGAAAIVNFVLLLISLRLFVRIFTRWALAPFLTLLFTVVLWGFEPWEWSGFFHLVSFSNVMGYPSTLATASAFLGIWAVRAQLLTGGSGWAITTAALAWITVLIHPPTFAFLGIGAVALVIQDFDRRHAGRAAAVAGAGAVGLGAALLWPYYPLVSLTGADPAGYLRDNDPLLALSGVVSKTFPAIVGLPFLVLRAIRRRRDALVWLFLGVSAAYLVARFGGIGSLATMIRFVVLALHVALAHGIAGLLAGRSGRWRTVLVPAGVAAALVVAVAWTATPSGRAMAALDDAAIPDLAFLATEVPDDEIVMADAITALEVPAWGPKVIAWHYAMPYVEDREERRADVDAFFAADASADTRTEILDRWCADWVLIVPERLSEVGGAEAAELAADGEPAPADAASRAILVRRPAPASCVAGS